MTTVPVPSASVGTSRLAHVRKLALLVAGLATGGVVKVSVTLAPAAEPTPAVAPPPFDPSELLQSSRDTNQLIREMRKEQKLEFDTLRHEQAALQQEQAKLRADWERSQAEAVRDRAALARQFADQGKALADRLTQVEAEMARRLKSPPPVEHVPPPVKPVVAYKPQAETPSPALTPPPPVVDRIPPPTPLVPPPAPRPTGRMVVGWWDAPAPCGSRHSYLAGLSDDPKSPTLLHCKTCGKPFTTYRPIDGR